ncbi:ATP-binding response regulator [Chitinophaga rhizosphaerae]|uniref:ATP-binding response regulator n=1 Tax=Chitinophaga rhizosphaerae TaxID=1864947 RepID=UPI0013DFA4F5|nr:ATP-binding protein [Chitinophaga rhizosphaerae]
MNIAPQRKHASIIHRFRHYFYQQVVAGTVRVQDPEDVARIIMVNKLSLTFGFIILLIAPVLLYLVKMHWLVGAVLLAEFMLNACVVPLNAKGHFRQAAMLMYLVQCCSIVVFGFLLGPLLQLEFTVVFLLSIIYQIFREASLRFWAFIAAIAVLLLVEVAYYFGKEEVLLLKLDPTAAFIIHVMVVFAVLVIVIAVSQPLVKSNDVNSQLRRANDFKRVFVYQVIHEIRTPLNAVFGVAQLLKKEIRQNKDLHPVEPLTDQLMSAAISAKNIVSNVLDMAAIESGKMESSSEDIFEVEPFFTNILNMNKVVAAGRQMRLRLEVENMPPVIAGDSLKLIQVTTNLVANAIKYGDKGKEILVRLTGSPPNWTIAVINEGPAIPPEKMSLIFEPFVTEKSRYTEGTGLGLFIVRNKVTAMGGTIGVESGEGVSTVFTVTLPLREARAEDLHREEAPKEQIMFPGVKVAVAEDNELNAFLLRRMLSQSGAEVFMSRNGLELIQQVEHHLPDIIILDKHMDIMDGEEALIRLKSHTSTRRIPVILTTGDVFVETRKNLEAAGADAIIEKPIDFRALATVMQQLLDRSAT